MEGYYFLSPGILKKDFNFFVIRDKRKFVRLFGNIHKADTPDFSREQVIVLAMPPEKKESTLHFAPTGMKAGHYIEIYCSYELRKHRLTYLLQPITVAAIPRFIQVREVHFYDEVKKKLLKKVRIK